VINDAVMQAGESVGRVTAGAWSLYLDCAIGYVRFDEPGDWAGKELVLKSSGSEEHECSIVALPFYDPDKEIPRGLNRSIP